MRLARYILLLLGLLIIFEASGKCQEKAGDCEEKKADEELSSNIFILRTDDSQLVTKNKDSFFRQQIEFMSQQIELPCPYVYVIAGIRIVPTFPAIFVADENGEIRVDRNLHCGKFKNKEYNGPILNPGK
jgi:hypothetical protein